MTKTLSLANRIIFKSGKLHKGNPDFDLNLEYTKSFQLNNLLKKQPYDKKKAALRHDYDHKGNQLI